MHVMSKYIDTYRATVAALEEYVAMQHILQTTDQAIKDKAEKLYWFNIPAPEGMPPVRNPKAGEDRIAAGTDRVDAYQQRYAQAREYMDWFLSSWGTLGEDDRFVLDTFFFAADDVSQEDRLRAVADRFFVERTTAHAKKSRAVRRLASALYG